MSNALERIRILQEERDKREREGVYIYRPHLYQEPVHKSPASELLVRGGKRSGKSMCAAVEFARRVTGMTLHGSDGKPIPSHWPAASPGFPRIYWIIGWDTKHIGQTIHKLLFQPGMGGQYRAIRDLHTGQWRTYCPGDPADVARFNESVLTEPLIPERMIVPDSWSWEEKRSNQFSSVELVNGAKIFAYPSTARQAKQGDAVSGIWIDEDIVYPEHLREWQDRLTDVRGWFMWSVWPHNKNEALVSLLERADAAREQANPRIVSFQLIMSENPFLPKEGKDEALERMGSEEEIARRDRGELLSDALTMYSFETPIHSIRRKNPDRVYEPVRSEAYEALRTTWEQLGSFPRDWTRYLAVDPSHTRTAALSIVVPPREVGGVYVGDVAIVEWELIARRMSAAKFAREAHHRMGDTRYEAFIMDKRAGRQTHAGREESTSRFYAAAFRDEGLSSRLTHSEFIPGCDVPQTRYRAVRDMLEVQVGVGIPGLMIVEERCPATKKEFLSYKKKRESRGEGMDMVLDEPANPRLFDCMAALEYGVTYLQSAFLSGKAYVDPSVYGGRGSAAYRHARRILARQESRDNGWDEGVVNLNAVG